MTETKYTYGRRILNKRVEQILLGHIESPKDTSCVQTVSSEMANIGSSKALLIFLFFGPQKLMNQELQ